MQQIQIPPLAEGEIHLCSLWLPNQGLTHTILLPGDRDPATWQEQMAWAKSIGGDLLSRAEHVIAYETHRGQFQAEAYWSNTEDDDPEYSGWAWCQNFYGSQLGCRQSNWLRARAVRRIVIS